MLLLINIINVESLRVSQLRILKLFNVFLFYSNFLCYYLK